MSGLKYKKARLIRNKIYRNSREFYHRLYTQKTLDDWEGVNNESKY